MPKEELIFGPHEGETYRQYRQRLRDDGSMTKSRADAAEPITNGAFRARAGQMKADPAFQRLARRYSEDPTFRRRMNESLTKSTETLQKVYDQLSAPANVQRSAEPNDRRREPKRVF